MGLGLRGLAFTFGRRSGFGGGFSEADGRCGSWSRLLFCSASFSRSVPSFGFGLCSISFSGLVFCSYFLVRMSFRFLG